MTGACSRSPTSCELVEVLADHEDVLLRVRGNQRVDDALLAVRGCRHPVALVGLGGRIDQALAVVEGHPHLDAVGRGDVALRLDVLPGRVVALGSDEGEDLALAAVLAHERGGQSETSARLDVRGEAEDRRGEQVHLVVDDQPPVARVEQLEVGVDALPLGRHHLVRRDGHRPDVLDRAGVLADLGIGERRTPEQLGTPLARRHRVGDEDQRGGLRPRHRRRTHDGLAGAARQHHDARAAVPEAVDRLALVAADRPAVLAQRDRVRLAVDVAREVLGGPAQLEQDLLEVAALGGVHDDAVVVDARADERLDLLAAQHLLEHGAVVRVQHQSVDRAHLQLQAAVAPHRLGDVDEQRVRDGVAREPQQGVDDHLGVVARGPGVPQPERGEPVGVHVLRGPLELRERGDGVTALLGQRVVDLQQEGLVALDDQGPSVTRAPRRGSLGCHRAHR
jgi:hypothetical protein